MKTNKRKFMPTSLEKRFMAIFLLGAALSWAAFRYLRLIPALAVLLVGCLVVWRLLHRYLIKPIQALTMAVLESMGVWRDVDRRFFAERGIDIGRDVYTVKYAAGKLLERVGKAVVE